MCLELEHKFVFGLNIFVRVYLTTNNVECVHDRFYLLFYFFVIYLTFFTEFT